MLPAIGWPEHRRATTRRRATPDKRRSLRDPAIDPNQNRPATPFNEGNLRPVPRSNRLPRLIKVRSGPIVDCTRAIRCVPSERREERNGLRDGSAVVIDGRLPATVVLLNISVIVVHLGVVGQRAQSGPALHTKKQARHYASILHRFLVPRVARFFTNFTYSSTPEAFKSVRRSMHERKSAINVSSVRSHGAYSRHAATRAAKEHRARRCPEDTLALERVKPFATSEKKGPEERDDCAIPVTDLALVQTRLACRFFLLCACVFYINRLSASTSI